MATALSNSVDPRLDDRWSRVWKDIYSLVGESAWRFDENLDREEVLAKVQRELSHKYDQSKIDEKKDHVDGFLQAVKTAAEIAGQATSMVRRRINSWPAIR
jgi:hypothetical protein